MPEVKQGPLSGVRVVDFTELLPGPFLTQALSELGADVLKIERPPHGDPARAAPGLFEAVNRGKRFARFDLKQRADLEEVRSLLQLADVVVEGFRPGVMARFGLAPEELVLAHPQLIVASLSGYGQQGPWSKLPGHDINYLATSGALALSGTPEGPPAQGLGLPVADLCGATTALASINAALFARTRTGRGCHLDIALADCMAWWMNPRLGQFAQAGMTDPDEQKKLSLVRPAYGAFRCLDGDSITIAAMEDHFWDKLVRTLELSEWAGAEFGKQTQRQQVAASINFSVAKKLASIRRDEALRRLSEADVPVAPVLSAVELLRTEHARSRGLPTPTSWGAVVRFPVTFN